MYLVDDNAEYCLIISGGDYEPIPKKYKKQNITYVIACDHGYDYSRNMHIKPNYVVGDFDSMNCDMSAVKESGAEYRTYPSEKDDTDTMLAVKDALARGYLNIIVCCAFGGRLDHTYANIQACAYGAKMGARVIALGKAEETILIGANGSTANISICRDDDQYLSVFSITDKCEDVTITGAKYNTERVTLTNTFPIGISNEFSSDVVNISLTKGIMMIISSGER